MNRLNTEISKVLDNIPVDFGGGCSLSQAYVMAWLIRHYRLRRTLDIGVYRGRSLFPQAMAHARYTGGKVYGVDPWDALEAMEHQTPVDKRGIEEFLGKTDFQTIYERVMSFKTMFGLDDHCTLLRKTSAAAADEFAAQGIQVDLIHIDGNHDTAKVMEDVRNYLPRLNPGGFVVMDDVSWESVKPACAELAKTSRQVFKRIDTTNDYSMYWRNESVWSAVLLSTFLRFVG